MDTKALNYILLIFDSQIKMAFNKTGTFISNIA